MRVQAENGSSKRSASISRYYHGKTVQFYGEGGVFHQHPAPHSWGKLSCVMSPDWDTAKPKQGTQQTLCTMMSQGHGQKDCVSCQGSCFATLMRHLWWGGCLRRAVVPPISCPDQTMSLPTPTLASLRRKHKD